MRFPLISVEQVLVSILSAHNKIFPVSQHGQDSQCLSTEAKPSQALSTRVTQVLFLKLSSRENILFTEAYPPPNKLGLSANKEISKTQRRSKVIWTLSKE